MLYLLVIRATTDIHLILKKEKDKDSLMNRNWQNDGPSDDINSMKTY